MLPSTVLPEYLGAYVQYVCPLRPQQCRGGLRVRVPPPEIQRRRLDFVGSLPEGLRGLTLDLLDRDRVDDVAFIEEHAEDYQRFVDLFEEDKR